MNGVESEPMRPPLDSRQLRSFVTLARTTSFTAAGRELSVSQSAISHSLKALETEVGCELFARIGKRVSLTRAGELLLRHAERILGEMSDARAALDQLVRQERGDRKRLRIGATTTACTHLLPSVLRRFKERFDDYAITLVPADAAQMGELVLAGHVEVGLTTEVKTGEKLMFDPLFEDELAFVLSPRHPWVKAGAVVRGEIARQNYVLYDRNSYTFRLVEDYFRREGVVLDKFLELDSKEAIKELLKLDMGISVLAPWVARGELESRSLTALPLGRRKLRRQWGVVRWRDRALSSAEQSFLALCKEVAVGMVREAARWVGATVAADSQQAGPR